MRNTYNNIATQQVGRPSLKSNAAQLILKYVLLHKDKLCNTWRSRIYYYSSATSFSDLCVDLKAFVESQRRGEKMLTRLVDVGNLRELVAEAIVRFVRSKPAFFKDAGLSKKHFWLVPSWKRAMVFVFMCHHALEKKGSSQWRNYSSHEHRFNVHAFDNYMSLDKEVIESSPSYRKMSADTKARVTRSRKAATTFSTTTSGSDTNTRGRYIMSSSDDSSDEEEADDDDDDTCHEHDE